MWIGFTSFTESQPGNENQAAAHLDPLLPLVYSWLPRARCSHCDGPPARSPLASAVAGCAGPLGSRPRRLLPAQLRLAQPSLEDGACLRPRMNLDLRQCLGNLIYRVSLIPFLDSSHGFLILVPKFLSFSWAQTSCLIFLVENPGTRALVSARPVHAVERVSPHWPNKCPSGLPVHGLWGVHRHFPGLRGTAFCFLNSRSLSPALTTFLNLFIFTALPFVFSGDTSCRF